MPPLEREDLVISVEMLRSHSAGSVLFSDACVSTEVTYCKSVANEEGKSSLNRNHHPDGFFPHGQDSITPNFTPLLYIVNHGVTALPSSHPGSGPVSATIFFCPEFIFWYLQ